MSVLRDTSVFLDREPDAGAAGAMAMGNEDDFHGARIEVFDRCSWRGRLTSRSGGAVTRRKGNVGIVLEPAPAWAGKRAPQGVVNKGVGPAGFEPATNGL